MTSPRLKEIETVLEALDKDIREADGYASHIQGRTRQLVEELQFLTDLTVSLDKYVRSIHTRTDKLRSLLSKLDRDARTVVSDS